jgi:hypothetical protein
LGRRVFSARSPRGFVALLVFGVSVLSGVLGLWGRVRAGLGGSGPIAFHQVKHETL